MFKNQDSQMFGLKLNKYVILPNFMSQFSTCMMNMTAVNKCKLERVNS